MHTKHVAAALIPVAALLASWQPATAAPPGPQLSGAIFTTDASGVPVNLNHYASKQDVYLNGGPGINAPASAAGLPAGTYSFQVTNPNGKVLLSEDDVSCRQFTVDDSGVIQAALAGPGCATGAHLEGLDGEDGGATIQLYPYADTPNPGGVYKVWVSLTSDLDCGRPGNKNCFVPRRSKTDNYKVRADAIVEIDARFWKDGTALLGKAATWTDTNGATNTKYSEYDPAMLAFREAHIEAVEPGTHYVTIDDQAGCQVDEVRGPDGGLVKARGGDWTVAVDVAAWNSGDDITYRVEVACK